MCVSDRLKTVKMCERAVQADPWQLNYVPNRFIIFFAWCT